MDKCVFHKYKFRGTPLGGGGYHNVEPVGNFCKAVVLEQDFSSSSLCRQFVFLYSSFLVENISLLPLAARKNFFERNWKLDVLSFSLAPKISLFYHYVQNKYIYLYICASVDSSKTNDNMYHSVPNFRAAQQMIACSWLWTHYQK